MGKLQYCVYVLYSKTDGGLYIGSTSDLKQRLTDHFHGNAAATAPRRPLHLIFCEYYLDKKDALRREMYLKTSTGRRALRIMLTNSLLSAGVV
ncbi:hypothetical protein A2810_01215 [candidate division Kazan bacterium RIFCSPHIGHO2_01_FULL_49_10]|uniref:GIY-YIG domain-containing protein n=1 Tax=candidate division Kazan bacterium RIFCSPLOWO2_01_FULL_48_13 TaxID=1798539 RepID=A0A1F4PPR2_UNCK3|nr:MAG: hypothetical protein A2810_01215 [candidate division Kazan bacterium RIFCSPHIGHO2_01_FULL_49_10]OGB85671.1 MAG: hypothetical protein A2994_02825 [candidate division Kazan bacterium RIFCSPLOWO2_01_FULL_48_13]